METKDKLILQRVRQLFLTFVGDPVGALEGEKLGDVVGLWKIESD